MESGGQPKTPGEAEAASQEAPDKATIELSREIFHLLANSITALKLFPAYHSTVAGFVGDLYAKLRSFFKTRSELEADVTDQAFLVGGEVVYREEHLAKSLPYLFYKDGMKKLSILREIDKTELFDFLEVIRKTALLPLDESDVVVALWEKDIPSIRIFAPDEYLLSKIDIFTKQPLEVYVDRRKLFSGQIDLSADDLKDIQDKTLSLGLMEQEEKKDYAELMTALEDKDRESIEALVGASREVPPEKEFHDMIFELLCLEDRAEKIVPILDFLERHHRELLREDKFTHAVQLLKQAHELKALFSGKMPEKAAALEKFLGNFPDGRIIELVHEAIGRRNFDSLPAFFEHLRLMGDRSVPLAAELLARAEEPETRRMAIDYLGEAGRKNIELLASQLQDGEPAVSREIIAMLGRNPSKKALSYLAQIKTYSNTGIKMAAIDTLGSMDDPLAQRILLEFLQDDDDEIGAAAAGRLRWLGDPGALERIIRVVSVGTFHDRGTRTKVGIMGFLARTGTPEALAAVGRAMARSAILNRAKREHTRLCAVEALAAAGTPEAREILSQGLKSRNKKVREACRRALEPRPEKNPEKPQG
jgi:hypothetical protein